MFAGLDVKPGSTVKCEPGYGFMLHLSQVALGNRRRVIMRYCLDHLISSISSRSDHNFFVSLTSCLPSSTMDLDSEDEDEELNVPVVKENDIFNNDLGGPYAFLEFNSLISGFNIVPMSPMFNVMAWAQPRVASPHGANHTGKVDGKKQKSQEKAVPAASKSSPASKKSKDDDDSDEDETDDSNEDETDDSDEGEGLSPEEGDDDDSSDEDDTSDDEEEDTSTPKKHEAGKKRAAESSVLKTPLSDKKAKVATPSAQKTGVPLNGLTKLSSKIV
ncbi:Histone deacetylase HDT3 [Zea mays]|uniref:Histone deacetylase HDT3 n=1 Tax=Zea mays TaxID=4577 RepID=A0A3L6FQW1_MAIZE|nr:Histone deacetylase HDT3 [Zea mays]